MFYRETKTEAAKLATGAIEKMDALSIEPNPQNFTIWYAYLSGRDRALTTKIDKMMEGNELSNEVQCAELYSTYLRSIGAGSYNERDDVFDAIGTELQRAIAETTEVLNGAGDESERFAETLGNVSGDLSSAGSDEQLKKVVSNLLEQTRRMAEQNRNANEHLQQSNSEISALNVRMAEIRSESLKDPLTGLANRRAFSESLANGIGEAESDQTPLALLMMDIDHFKSFNDNFGHQLGDEVIRLVAGCAKANIKGKDTAARYGGEEFAVVLPSTQLKDGQVLAEQIRKVVAGQKIVRKASRESLGSVTISIGVSQYRPGEAEEDFIARADAALYAAKHTGRNCVCVEDADNNVINLPTKTTAA